MHKIQGSPEQVLKYHDFLLLYLVKDIEKVMSKVYKKNETVSNII
jgi:hypothetical protein